MRPRSAASWQADKMKRNLLYNRVKTQAGRWRISAIYLSFPGHPCTPEKLLWADWTTAFSKRPNWRTIHNQIKAFAKEVTHKHKLELIAKKRAERTAVAVREEGGGDE